jgi:hypothetical protein
MTNASGPFLLGPEFAVTDTTPMVLVQAQPPTTNNEPNGGRGADFGKSSPVGLLVMLLFLIAVVFLVRSMTKHLKRVPESFDPPSDEPTEPTEAEASESQEKPKTTNGS